VAGAIMLMIQSMKQEDEVTPAKTSESKVS